MSTTREEALTIVQHAQPNEIFIQHLKDGRTRIDIAAHKEVKRGKWAQVADTFTVKSPLRGRSEELLRCVRDFREHLTLKSPIAGAE